MELSLVSNILNGLELSLSICALVLLLRSRSLSVYWPMLVIATWQVVPDAALIIGRDTDLFSLGYSYKLFFYTYWVCYGFSSLSALLLTYTLFDEALRPLKGLRRLGSIIYQWTAVVSFALALNTFFSADGRSSRSTIAVTIQLHRSSAVMVLSLIVFVGLAIRPLGLSARSRVFGLSVGLVFITLFTLLQSAALFRENSVFSNQGLLNTVANCIALSIWVYYFYVPEPKRRFILLPTNSPFNNSNHNS